MRDEQQGPGAKDQGRRAMEKEARRNYILGVAEELFAAKGLHNTSVADIAGAAEFGIGTIYKYFKDKPTLIQSLMEDRLTAHFDGLEAAIEQGGSTLEIVDRLIEFYFDSVVADKAFFSMFYTHFHPGPKDDPHAEPLNLEYVQTRKLRLIEMTRKMFEKGVKDGELVDIDPDYLASALLGLLVSFFCFAEVKFKEEWDVEGLKRAVRCVLVNGMVRTTKTESESESEARVLCREATGETI